MRWPIAHLLHPKTRNPLRRKALPFTGGQEAVSSSLATRTSKIPETARFRGFFVLFEAKSVWTVEQWWNNGGTAVIAAGLKQENVNMINLFTLSKAVLVIYYNSSDDGIHRGFSNLCFSLLGSYLFAELTKIGGRGAKANLLPITWSFSANKPPVQLVVNKNTLRLIQSSWRMKWPTRCISGQSWTI